MSVKLMSAIFEAEFHDLEYVKDGESRKAKASTLKLVLLAIADHANDDGEAYPGYTKLERKTALSRQGLSDTLDALKYNGLIAVDDKLSKLHTNNYTINVRCLPKIARELSDIIEPTNESSHLTSRSQATLLDVVKPLDSNHQLTTNKPLMAETTPPETPFPVEWQIGAGADKIVLPTDEQEWEARVDIAVMNICRSGMDLQELASAFIHQRKILPAKKTDAKGWAGAFREMKQAGAKPEHIIQAIQKLCKDQMTVADPWSIKKTVIALAVPAQGAAPIHPKARTL